MLKRSKQIFIGGITLALYSYYKKKILIFFLYVFPRRWLRLDVNNFKKSIELLSSKEENSQLVSEDEAIEMFEGFSPSILPFKISLFLIFPFFSLQNFPFFFFSSFLEGLHLNEVPLLTNSGNRAGIHSPEDAVAVFKRSFIHAEEAKKILPLDGY